MFKPGDAMRALDRALDSPAATALAMVTLLAVPLAASSGAGSFGAGAPSRPASPSVEASAPISHQMRCWQRGRLLFEQNLLALPAAGTVLKISGTDREGRPVYVAETSHATCLIRSLADEHPAHAG